MIRRITGDAGSYLVSIVLCLLDVFGRLQQLIVLSTMIIVVHTDLIASVKHQFSAICLSALNTVNTPQYTYSIAPYDSGWHYSAVQCQPASFQDIS